MRKITKTLLSLSIIAEISFSTHFKASALTVDQLYLNAFTATQISLSTGTQANINSARVAINALKGTGAAWAIGQLSGEVDTVQQPILVRAITAITNAQNNPTQANVNAAKLAIDPALPQIWINAYSSAVDKVEQGIIDDAVSAYSTANSSKLPDDITKALNKVADLLTSNDYNIVAYADTLESQINAIDDGSIRDGMYKVGTDVQPGNYIVIGSNGGYVQVSSDSTGSLESIIMNDILQGREYITITNGQYLTLKNVRMYPIDKAPSVVIVNNHLTTGQYRVGVDIQPGEYKIHSDSSNGYVEVDKDSYHNLQSIVTNNIFTGDSYITVVAGEYITIKDGYIILNK